MLPALCVAATQARLSPLPGGAARVAVAAALAAAWGALHPAALSPNLRPWLRLSAIEALAALALATGTARLLGGVQLASLHVLRAVLPATAAQHRAALCWAGALAVACGAAVHPAFAAYAGMASLALQLAAATKQQAAGSTGGSAGPALAATRWLVFYGQLALLPSASLYSWVASGREQAVPWSDGWALTAALALHAAVACSRGSATRPGVQQPRAGLGRLPRAAVHEAAAATAATASLWGHPFVCVYAACVSAVVEVWGAF